MLKRFPNDGTGRQFQKRSSRKKPSDIIIRQVLARYRVKSHYVIYVISAYMTATALLIFEIIILNLWEALSYYFASMAHGTATWANKFKWKPVLQLFPRYFIPQSLATCPCQSGTYYEGYRLVKLYNSCSRETVTCYDVPNMRMHCSREKAVSIKLSILWLRKKGIKLPVRIIVSLF